MFFADAIQLPFRLLACLVLQFATVNEKDADKANSKNECGCRCLYVAMAALSGTSPVDYGDLVSELRPNTGGATIEDLKRVAEDHGYQTRAVTTTFESLRNRRRPFVCIAFVRDSHFLIVKSVGDDTVEIIDPPIEKKMPIDSFGAEWNGVAFLVSTQVLESEEEIAKRVLFRKWAWVGTAALATAMLTFVVSRIRRRVV